MKIVYISNSNEGHFWNDMLHLSKNCKDFKVTETLLNRNFPYFYW